MDNIDKSLNTLMQQIDSMDATPHHTSAIPTSNFFSGNGNSTGFTYFAKQYFFFWSLFLFLVITILIIRPSFMYHKNPTNGKETLIYYLYEMLKNNIYLQSLIHIQFVNGKLKTTYQLHE